MFRRRRPLQGMRRRSSAVMGRTRRTVRGCRSHPPGRFRCWPAPPGERRSDHCLPAPRLMGSPTSLHCTNCGRTLRFRGRSRHRACPQVPWQLAHRVPRRLREHPEDPSSPRTLPWTRIPGPVDHRDHMGMTAPDGSLSSAGKLPARADPTGQLLTPATCLTRAGRCEGTARRGSSPLSIPSGGRAVPARSGPAATSCP